MKLDYTLKKIPVVVGANNFSATGADIPKARDALISQLETALEALKSTKAKKSLVSSDLASGFWVDGEIPIDKVEELIKKLGVCEDVAYELLSGKKKLTENCYCINNELTLCKNKETLLKKLQKELDEWSEECDYDDDIDCAVTDFKEELQMVIVDGKKVNIGKMKIAISPMVRARAELKL